MFNDFPFPQFSAFKIVSSIVIAVFIFVIIKNLYEWIKNNNSEIVEVPARIITKRTHTYGSMNRNMGSARTTYYMTFEYGKSIREEFRVSGKVFGHYAEGDIGVLRFQGTRFLDFILELD